MMNPLSMQPARATALRFSSAADTATAADAIDRFLHKLEMGIRETGIKVTQPDAKHSNLVVEVAGERYGVTRQGNNGYKLTNLNTGEALDYRVAWKKLGKGDMTVRFTKTTGMGWTSAPVTGALADRTIEAIIKLITQPAG